MGSIGRDQRSAPSHRTGWDRRWCAVSRRTGGWIGPAVFLAVLATATVSETAAAQEESPPTRGEAERPAAETAGQIATRAQALEERLDTIRTERPTQIFEQIATELEQVHASVEAEAERTDALLGRPATSVEIDGQAKRLRELDRRFGALEERVRTEADLLDQTLSEIREQTEAWTRTRKEARASNAPAAVLRTADQALAGLAAAKRQVGDDLAAALKLLERFDQPGRTLRSNAERIQAARKELAESLWVRRSEPVWRAIPTAEELGALHGEIGQRLSVLWNEAGPDLSERRDATIVQGLIFLLVAWLLTRARTLRDAIRSGPPHEGSDSLRHPWAAGFLIAMLISPLLGLSDVRFLRLAVMPVALASWLAVVWSLVAPDLRRPLLGVAVLCLLETLRQVMPGLPVANRLILGLDLALALAGVLWLLQPGRRSRLPWRSISDPWLRLLVPFTAGGLLANLLGYTALASALSLLAIWGTAVGAGWAAIVQIGQDGTRAVLDAGGMRPLRMARTSRSAFLRALRRSLEGLGVAGWAYAALGASGLLRPVLEAVRSGLSASIGFGTVSISLGGILGFFLTLWVAWLIARLVSFSLDQELFSRVRTPPGVSYALSTFTRYTIIVFGFLVAMGAVGFSLDRVALLLSALGVGIGFGLQNVVNNFVSGLILLFERPIRVGDWIQIGELFGTVTKMGIRSSTVRTFDGADVVVPNGDLVAAQLINWTLSDRKRRIILPIGVAYGTDPRRVLELLMEVAVANDDVLGDPEPTTLFRSFGDSSLDFELRVFTEADWLKVTSDLAVAVNEALAEAGITIPFPQRDLWFRNAPEMRDAPGERPGEPGDRT